MKTGIELIATERSEQIEKHGYHLTHDVKHHDGGELIIAAEAIIDHITSDSEIDEIGSFPASWEDAYCFKILRKSKIDKLVIAGALIAAEIDRLQNQ